jgi:hypothetical protein
MGQPLVSPAIALVMEGVGSYPECLDSACTDLPIEAGHFGLRG